MNPLDLGNAPGQPVRIGGHERDAVRNRLAQITIALGHPQLTDKQSAALIQERMKLERTLAANDGAA